MLFDGDRRFDVVVRLSDAERDDIETLGSIPIMLPAGDGGVARSIPLREVARFSFTEGLNQISRENGKRMVVVQANVRDRGLGGFVEEARAKIATVKLPSGSFIAWGGTFESLQSATERLAVVVPLVFVLIFALLYVALGGFGPAIVVFSAVPMALAGGTRAEVQRPIATVVIFGLVTSTLLTLLVLPATSGMMLRLANGADEYLGNPQQLSGSQQHYDAGDRLRVYSGPADKRMDACPCRRRCRRR